MSIKQITMQTFEIEVLDVELVHYATTYKVEAENEEEAKRLVLAGEIDSLDVETYNHTEFDLEVAKQYVDGKVEFKQIEYCRPVQSDAELETIKIYKEIGILQDKLKVQMTKLDFLKG